MRPIYYIEKLNKFPWSTDWINAVHSVTKYSTDYRDSLDSLDEVAPSTNR